jgi:hypothetical protein
MIRRVCLLFVSILFFISCNDSNKLQEKIDNLEAKTLDNYKPGFGEFMTNVQIHHAKLWFAGKNQNWKLADFEIHEIKESLDDILKFQSNREESKALSVINAPLDSVSGAIEKKDLSLFMHSFTTLTNTCNACHEAVKFEFNKVKIPDTPPFSNQDFSVGQK